MEDDYDSGDDLFDGVDPEELESPKKRSREVLSDDEQQQQPKRAKGATLSSGKDDHLDLARSILHDKFGHDSFRHEQEKAIKSVLNGNNTLTIFPTGAGKSLCYQVSTVILFEIVT